jgi:hypothetical protein
MAEASIQWKVDTLRAIIAAPLHSRFVPNPGTEEMAWFIDMEKDGYVEGTWGREVDMERWKDLMAKSQFPVLPTGEKEVCSFLHVTEKGKRFVRDYDAQQKAADDLKIFDVQEFLKWNGKKLADWQSQYKPDQAQWILAEQEWKRRAGISTRRIAIAAIVVSVLSFIVAALGYFHSLNGDTSTAPEKSLDQPAKQPQLSAPATK